MNPRSFKNGWDDARKDFKIAEVWDINNRLSDRDVILQCATALTSGKAGHNGFNWWGHSTCTVGMEWDESQSNNVQWYVRNSHGERKPIIMTGSRAVPDEIYFYVSSELA